MKNKHIILPVCVMFALSFVIWTFSSLFMHTKMLTNSIAYTSQIACGQTAQKIIVGLSYGKEISNYSGIDDLLLDSIKLYPQVKNMYICDTNGVICGSYIKMMDKTELISKKIDVDKVRLLDVKLHKNEVHILRALEVSDNIIGYIATVIDAKSVISPLIDFAGKEIAISFAFCTLSALICILLLMRIKKLKPKKGKLFKAFSCIFSVLVFMLSSLTVHLNVQKVLLNNEIEQQSEMMAKTINIAVEGLIDKGIEMENVTGFDSYLQDRLYGLTALNTITLEDKQSKECYTEYNSKKMTTAYTNQYLEMSYFNITIGISKEEYVKYRSISVITWLIILAVLQLLTVLYVLKKEKKIQDNQQNLELKGML